jgi:hypothetical protein
MCIARHQQGNSARLVMDQAGRRHITFRRQVTRMISIKRLGQVGSQYLGDQVNNVILGTHLHCNWEIGSSVWGEEHVHTALVEGAVTNRATNLEDMQL